MNNLGDSHCGDRSPGARPLRGERSRGQILILFVMAIFVFTGMVALVIDVSWYWVSSLRVQRAADAAALAGVVQLPTNPTGAYALARAEATKNGYTGSTSVTITSVQEPVKTGRRLAVTISAPIDTFFMKLLGIDRIMSTRVAKAEYILPVPMGSPENYYGVFGKTRGLTSTSTTTVTNTTNPVGDSGLVGPTSAPTSANAWAPAGGTLITAVSTNDGTYAQANADGDSQQWGSFHLLGGLAPSTDTATTVNGIEVELIDAYVDTTCPGSFIQVALSYDGGVHWTAATANNRTADLTTVNSVDYPLGNAANVNAWPLSGHVWTGDDLGNSNFRLRLTANMGCGTAGAQIRVDQIQVRALYGVDRVTSTLTTTTTNLPDVDLQGPGLPCLNGVAGCFQATGDTLEPRGFWGTMNTQGAESINGDAHQPYFNVNSTGVQNPDYNADDYYNYAVEMPADSTGGSVYVYDPVFCATAHDKGTGDRWFSQEDRDPVSSFFELYDTNGTLWDRRDDGDPIASSDGLFRNVTASDTTMGGSGGSQCRYATDATYGDGRDYHNHWYLLASGLDGGEHGKVYRVHTTSTDPVNANAQRGTDGENSFALFVNTTGARIYGIGAMQAFTPLTASGSPVQSEFYLAQIEAVHAGKTVEIKLWDPGDTKPLSASLAILVPNSGGWSTTLLDYTAAQGTTNGAAADCNTESGEDVPAIETNEGNTGGTFNGCWLTITIPIPGDYTGEKDGWWKIRYTMDGSGTSNDVTTWKVAIRGNPVHLIVN